MPNGVVQARMVLVMHRAALTMNVGPRGRWGIVRPSRRDDQRLRTTHRPANRLGDRI